MQFIGTSTWDHEGKVACKIRNKTNRYLVLPPISLDKYGDLRYVEFFEDFAGQLWARKPAGSQTKVLPPYTVVMRLAPTGSDVYDLVSKDFT